MITTTFDNESQSTLTWNNEANTELFYNTASIETVLRGYEEKGGLSCGCDVEILKSYIMGTKSLLEVGAGYGRVVNYLLQNNYKGEIHAIENSELFQSQLLNYFGDSIYLHKQSVLDFITDQKFHVILSMWSGISDFSPKEQQQFINKLAFLLEVNGTICIDTVVWDQKPLNAESVSEQYYVINPQGTYLRGYIPTCNEMRTYAKQAGLSKFMVFNYKTDTQRERLMYILKK